MALMSGWQNVIMYNGMNTNIKNIGSFGFVRSHRAAVFNTFNFIDIYILIILYLLDIIRSTQNQRPWRERCYEDHVFCRENL